MVSYVTLSDHFFKNITPEFRQSSEFFSEKIDKYLEC